MVYEHAARAIDDDADKAPWEEIERNLRHHGMSSPNFLALMGLRAVIALAGLLSAPMPQAGLVNLFEAMGIARWEVRVWSALVLPTNVHLSTPRTTRSR